MYKDLKFPVLIVHRDIKADTVAGDRVRGIARELEQEGFSIVSAMDYTEGRLVASTHHGLSCMLIAAEDASAHSHLLQNMAELIGLARVRAPDLPIFALGEQVTLENAPADAMAELNQLRGILYLFEDTVPFLARQVARAARKYLDGLLPPFFKALVQHTADSNYSWHTPGHGGGVAYHKSPVGQAFHQFFGENTLRSDLSVSVPELGSLLDHTGPLAEAEARAARNFGADHTFFVINGTSTANLTLGARPLVSGLASVLAWIDSRLNSLKGIGPMIPSSLRSGHKYSGIAPVMMIECSTDLWQLRSTSTRSSRATTECQTILLAVEVPLITKKV